MRNKAATSTRAMAGRRAQSDEKRAFKHCVRHETYDDACHDCYDEYGGKAPAAASAAAPAETAIEEIIDRTPHRIEDVPELADVLPSLCKRYREVQTQAAKLEAERKELSSQIEPLMAAVGYNNILSDEWEAVRARGTNVQVSRERLLEKGVSMDVVDYATVKKHYWYIQVRKPGDKRGC